MKKSTLAIGVIAALGIVWAGGAWYTGKTAEAEYQRQIDFINKNFAAKSANMGGITAKIEDVKFNRGFFSSDFSYDMAFGTETTPNFLNIPFEGKLYHGPIPLNQLSKFNLSPAMFSATTQLVKNEKTQTWFDTAKGKNPAIITTTMDYSQRMKGDGTVVAGKMQYEGIDMAWSDIIFDYDADNNGYGRYDFQAAQIKALFNREALVKFSITEDEPLQKMDVEITDVKGSYNLQPTDLANIFVGKFNGAFGGVKYSYIYQEGSDIPAAKMEFKNWVFDYNAEKKGEFLDYSLKNTLDSISVNEYSLGKLAFDLQANHLLATAMNRLVVADPSDEKAMEQGGLELLQNQPHFVIKPLSLTNESGKIEADLNINLANANFAAAMQGKILSLFKELSFNFNADKAALTSLISVGEQISGTPKEDAEKLAKEEVGQLIAEGVQQQAIIDNDKSISSSLVLENNELKFNGNVIPEEHIGMFLLGLMMSQQ